MIWYLADATTDPAMPNWVRNLAWAAAAAAFIATIWNRLHMQTVMGRLGGVLTLLSHEMQPNGGGINGTIKDQMTACARDSKQALELAVPIAKDSRDAAKDSREALGLTVKLDERLAEHLVDIQGVKDNMLVVEGDVRTLDKRQNEFAGLLQGMRHHFNRLLIHYNNNTLNASNLLREVEKMEAEEAEEAEKRRISGREIAADRNHEGEP